MRKCLSILLILVMVLMALPIAASADATIDTTQTGSLTIYKYDLTLMTQDGVEVPWENTSRVDLGNQEVSFGYAVKGVEFTYLKVAEIATFNETKTAEDGTVSSQIQILYGIDKTDGATLLAALGFVGGSGRYTAADELDSTKYYYQSDALVNALSAALAANPTAVKNTLANYAATHSGVKMPMTDSYGKTTASGLDLGLYLVLETKVPEMVTTTTNPFLISLPLSGEEGWNYDVTVYPKSESGVPTLEKTLRGAADTTGIHDGYAHTGTASAGDLIDYQIISTLPAITSAATYLSRYGFTDILSGGLTYKKDDVKLQIFADAGCTVPVTSWTENSGMFTVNYSSGANGATIMRIDITAAGLNEINTSSAVYNTATMVNSGYSGCTMRITYQAVVGTDGKVVYGDNGNPNEAVLTWQRTSTEYFDSLADDAHLYVYGLDLTKVFTDGKGEFGAVEFVIQNYTDGYYLKAELDQTEGVYYVKDQVADASDATHFAPVIYDGKPGRIVVKGIEADEYLLTETKTAKGYTLLQAPIRVVIEQAESEDPCPIYTLDNLGLIQNDPRYNGIQTHLEHHTAEAVATVNGATVAMVADNGSPNARVLLSVVNGKGFDLPETGDTGTWIYPVVGILIMAISISAVAIVLRRRADN